MKHLKQYLELMDGSWGAEARYDDVVAPERGRGNWAYLCGHYKLLLGEAIKLLGGRKDALRFASAHIEKCARCGEECRESSITSTDLLSDLMGLADHQIPGYAFGDNEAACDMDMRLKEIYTMAWSALHNAEAAALAFAIRDFNRE